MPARNAGLAAGARIAMEPAGVTVRYVDALSRERREDGRDAFAPFENDDIGVEAAVEGDVLELAVVPKRPVQIDFAQTRLRHAFATEEKVLLNGYQSWTDTAERPAWSRMRGLRGMPGPLVRRFALDGSGDYAFADYPARRGLQHGFTYATFRRGEAMVLVGSLCEDEGFTLIQADARRGAVLLETECPARTLDAGERCVLGRYAIVRGDADECYDRWFGLSGWQAREVRPLVGYTSWYRHYGDIDAEKLLGDLRGAEKQFSALGCGASGQPAAFVPLFQIDDGYCKVGDWAELDSVKFPQGLAPLAAEAKSRGFVPGLWVAPFLCEKESRLFAERPDWLLRGEDGEPVRTGPQWSGGYALDTRNPEVRTYILDTLQTMVRDWGFGLLKADFLYAACMVEHDGMNRGQLMADALDLLRLGAGDGTLILGCGVPLGSAFGRVDYCRIGCDVGLDWDDKPHMRLLHRERVSTKNSLGNTYARQPLDGRAFGNDPDVFFLRDDVRLTRAKRDELLFADADCASALITSDDMGAWTDRDRGRFQEALRVLLGRDRRKGRR